MNRKRMTIVAALALAGLVSIVGCSSKIDNGNGAAQASSAPSASATKDSKDEESAEPTKDSTKDVASGSSSIDLSKTQVLDTWIPGLDKPSTCEGGESTIIGGGAAVVSCSSSASIDDQSAALKKVIEDEGGKFETSGLSSLGTGTGTLSDGTAVNALITSKDGSTDGGIVLTIGSAK